MRTCRASKSGAALITVLAFLVIATVLTIAIAATSLFERRSSGVADTVLQSETLVRTIENLVQSQIRTATTLPATQSWASQPGMIRTFNNDGSLAIAHKLYSSANQQITSQSTLDSELAREASIASNLDFTNRPATFADINRPDLFNGRVTYPVADPRALGKVDGFQWAGTTTAPTDTFTSNGTSTSLPVLPMPVQWLYVLRDGTLTTPDPAAGNGRRIPIPGASATNPVVGRVAYWTDDDSTKLNINTAGDGVFWDTPRAGTFYINNPALWLEGQLGLYQPANREYQRYPGHPAMTSLRPVFQRYLAESDPLLANADTNAAADAALRRTLMSLSPAYRELDDSGNPTGSNGGTRYPPASVPPRTERLYTSPDELKFSNDRAARTSITEEMLEQTRFFLTASSRAPEVNLFNMPRVSLWPVRPSPNAAGSITTRTINDSLNLFCTSLGDQNIESSPVTNSSNVYALTRSSPLATTELNSGRNAVLYDYLNTLMKRPFPGFGPNTFAQKYGDDQEQILTEMLDFIRITNSYDISASSNNVVNRNLVFALPPGNSINDFGSGQVIPSRKTSNNTSGFGRVITISEAAIVVVGEQNGADPATTYNARPSFILEMCSVAPGARTLQPRIAIEVTGLENLRVDPGQGQPEQPLFPANYNKVCSIGNVAVHMSGTFGTTWHYALRSARSPFPTNHNAFSEAPWIGSKFPATPIPATQSFSPWPPAAASLPFQFTVRQDGPITVKIFEAGNMTTPVQTIALRFPNFTQSYPLPLGPNVVGNNLNPVRTWDYTNRFLNDDISTTLQKRWEVRSIPNFGGAATDCLIPHANDAIRSLVPLGPVVNGGNPVNGDVRAYAGLESVPDSVFTPNRNYFTDSRGGECHSFTDNADHYGDDQLYSGRFGRLTQGGPINVFSFPSSGIIASDFNADLRQRRNLPDIPPINFSGANMDGVLNAFGKPGDFDTGVSWCRDGPWINKPDEGDMSQLSSTDLPYFKAGTVMDPDSARYSPNRQVASPVQLGSLPTGLKTGRPWETLLFCPNPAALTSDGVGETDKGVSFHRGFQKPYDHLLLDLFWIPVVEPYAISDPFSTSGKINLNHQLVPFSEISRDSALRGLLQSARVTAIPLAHEEYSKGTALRDRRGDLGREGNNYRYPIDPDRTIAEINAFASRRGFFRSATEICEVFLIPRRITDATVLRNPVPTNNLSGSNIISQFWNLNSLTGDNLRERPYNTLYPRLTTQSNVYTIHYTAQTLRKTPASSPTEWDEDKDVVQGEKRGAITLERFIDPRDPEFTEASYDFAQQAGTSNPPTLGRFYRFRTVSTRDVR